MAQPLPVDEQVLITQEWIGPEEAKVILGGNTRNRRLRERTLVDSFARDMVNGNWRFTGDPIQIAPDGLLLNGQHRLHAIIRANVRLKFVVIRNVDPAAQDVMDTGGTRSPGDVLTLRGLASGKQLAAAAGQLKQIYRTK